jgi:hypothetical protein
MFPCSDCGREFCRRAKLRRHEARYHPYAILKRDLMLSDESSPSSPIPAEISPLKKLPDLSMGSTASSDYKVRSTSQVDVSEKFLKQSVFDGNNNVVADGGDLSVPPVITLDKPVSGHSRGERSSSQSGAAKKRVTYSWLKAMEMPCGGRTFLDTEKQETSSMTAFRRRPTAPMAVFTPRPRPPSFSILPGPVVRGISSGILPSHLVDLVEDFPSVSANEIFETAVAPMGLGPRTQAEVKNALEAITDARSRVAASLDGLIEQSRSLKKLQAGLRQLSYELSHC